jgi:hypothetical protein
MLQYLEISPLAMQCARLSGKSAGSFSFITASMQP